MQQNLFPRIMKIRCQKGFEKMLTKIHFCKSFIQLLHYATRHYPKSYGSRNIAKFY